VASAIYQSNVRCLHERVHKNDFIKAFVLTAGDMLALFERYSLWCARHQSLQLAEKNARAGKNSAPHPLANLKRAGLRFPIQYAEGNIGLGERDMVIADRLKAIRESKNMSQGDIEKRTGLLRCYISRVENGHTVPAIETLEKLARAMDVPMYALFYDGEKPPAKPKVPQPDEGWGGTGRDARTLGRFRRLLARTNAKDRVLLMHMASMMVARKRRKKTTA
jgi:transcriptional regulator with XRE-family HTH domain